ncbi:DUF5110 domain-containing protein, partial [Mucilaginibacter sp.]|uniref:glycoside hydrolase family 31 protein n=1 Tax=Mucilaginibacter sp. TaxID=1882438 RepID=UPI002632AE5D
STQTGLPLSRTLAIDYTWDENIFDTKYQNQFLFGDALLVAPVISTAENVAIYLPAGEWYLLSTDEKFNGGKVINVACPLSDLPVFVIAGGIVPMQNIIQSTNEAGDGILLINVWNGNEANEFVYYEDDGLTYDHQHGSYYKRVITFDPQKRELVFGEVEGSYQSKYNKIKVAWHGFEGGELDTELENKSEEFKVSY